MFLVYDDQPSRSNANFDPSRINANKCYLEHYANSLYLLFMLQNGTMEERAQASKELALCDRKLKFHEHHPNFDWEFVRPRAEKVKKNWATTTY